MSQAGIIDISGALPSVPTLFNADVGSAVAILNTLEIFGDAAQGSATSGAGNTITITNLNASETQTGVLQTSTDVESIAGSSTAAAVVPSSLKAKLGIQTANAIPYGTGTAAALGWSSALTDGQVVIGSTGLPPVAASITAGPGVVITPGAGSLTIGLTGGAIGIDSVTPDSGISPVVADGLGNINVVGSGSTTTVGTVADTISVQLTGLTNHAVLVGAGTATITKVGPTATAGHVLQSAGAAADPAFSTATYPLTTTVSQLLYSSATNVVSGLATANKAVVTTTATGVPVVTALATDGQLIIGSTAGAPAAATLTAGAGITIANGSNSITIAASSGGYTWNNVTGTSATMVKQNGYQANNAGLVTLTMPTVASSTDRKSTRLNSSHGSISYAVFCLKKNKCAHDQIRHPWPTGNSHDAVEEQPEH